MLSQNSNPPGLLDTNVVVHAHTYDTHSEECRRFLLALERGEVRARLEPLILHELSYALRNYFKQMGRSEIAAYLAYVLSWEGLQGDKALMADTVQRWATTPGLAFADAYLAALATREHCPVYTKNVRELTGQGVAVPDPLPS